MTQNLMAATSSLPSVLVSNQLTSTETTLFTCPAASSVKIAQATVMNTANYDISISLHLVKAGGTAGTTSRVASFIVGPSDSRTLGELVGHFLGPGDFISASAVTSSLVVLTVSGVVFS